MKIYTKTGDSGETSLADGKRVPKYHIRLEAYGTIDELNAHIGLLRSVEMEKYSVETLNCVQNQLFSIGALLATENNSISNIPPVNQSDIELLEKEIDRLTEKLPPLRSFILPGGSLLVSYCHIARTICRRTERICYKLNSETKIDTNILVYLNRLSDYLFTLSRRITADSGIKEQKWKA